MDSNEGTLPKDAQTIVAILKDMGVTDYEPKVVHQLLEFTYRYISDVLDDSKTYANHAGRTSITMDDAKLAIQSQLNTSFQNPPPRDFLVEAARQKNNTTLPPLKNFSGARLPPDRYCLSAVNYRLAPLPEQKLSWKSNINRQNSQPQAPQRHQFINPQIIMPSNIKRKWNDDDDYDN